MSVDRRRLAQKPTDQHPDHLHTFGSRGVCQVCRQTRGDVYAELGQLEAAWVAVGVAAPAPAIREPGGRQLAAKQDAAELECACGHGHTAHQHYRPGSNCSSVSCTCVVFQPPRGGWLRRNCADVVGVVAVAAICVSWWVF